MIHVVGNAAIDTIFRVDRFPLPGETIVARAVREDLGGKGVNQAVAAARAGANVRLAAAIGADAAGARIRAVLRAEGVADALAAGAHPTDRSSIYVDTRGENTIVSVIRAAAGFDPLAAGGLEPVGAGDMVLCQGNLAVEALVGCLREARRRRAVTVLNPSPLFRLEGFDWRLVDVAVMNDVEAAEIDAVRRRGGGTGSLRDAGVGTVIVTRGSRGAIMAGEETMEVAAPQVDVVDTTGAGDVFCGTLAAMRDRGMGWRPALSVATAAAAIAVTRPGVYAAFPTADELRVLAAGSNGGTVP